MPAVHRPEAVRGTLYLILTSLDPSNHPTQKVKNMEPRGPRWNDLSGPQGRKQGSWVCTTSLGPQAFPCPLLPQHRAWRHQTPQCPLHDGLPWASGGTGGSRLSKQSGKEGHLWVVFLSQTRRGTGASACHPTCPSTGLMSPRTTQGSFPRKRFAGELVFSPLRQKFFSSFLFLQISL